MGLSFKVPKALTNIKDFKKSGLGKASMEAVDYANLSGIKNPDKPSTKEEEAAMRAALEQWSQTAPKSFEDYRYAGDVNPEMIGDLPQLQDSRLSEISTDPRLRSAQMAALEELQNVGRDGFTSVDKAALGSSMDQAAQQERSQRDAILANQGARGMGGSGSELAAQLSNQQGSAMRGAQTGAAMGLAGRQRALEAVMQSGSLAGNMQGQEFDQAARIAQAQDVVNRFNTETGIGRAQQNNALANSALMANRDARQGVSNNNTAGKNTFAQQAFDNQEALSGARTNQATNQANKKLADYQGEMEAQAARTSGILQTAGTVVGGVYGGPGGAAAGGAAGQGAGGVLTADQKKKRGTY